MAKKRLSDLLREEVNKSAEDAEQPAETSAKSAEAAADAESAEENDAHPVEAVIEIVVETVAETVAETGADAPPPQGEPLRLGVHPSQQTSQPKADAAPEASASTHRRSPTKAELESTIADLQSQLQAAQQQNQQQETQIEQLKQQIDRLQSDVKQQKTTIEQLQTEGQHSQSLKAELEEARQVILKLSEINAKPVDAKYASKDGKDGKDGMSANGAAQPANLHHVKAGENKAPQSSSAGGKIESRPALSRSGAPIMPAPANAAEPELESKPVQLTMPGAGRDSGKLAPPTRHQQELRRILDHPTRPGSLPPMSTPSEDKKSEDKKLSETDMGWVD